jgi:hypothetical protein
MDGSDAIDHAKDCRIGPNAQRSVTGHGRETWALEQLTKGKFDVVHLWLVSRFRYNLYRNRGKASVTTEKTREVKPMV